MNSFRSGRPLGVPLAVRVVQACLAASLLVYLASLTWRAGAGYDVVFEGWVANFALAMCPLLCFLRALWNPVNRAAFACLGLGGLFFTAGNVAYVAHVQYLDPLPYPAVADIGYLGAYPFFVAALFLLARAGVGRRQVGVWLDGLVGVLGFAAVGGAVVVHTTVDALSGGRFALVVGASYPLCDLLLLSMIVGVLTLFGGWPSRQWVFLAFGLGIFAVGDITYLLRLSTDSYQQGTFLDALWLVGLAILSLSAWQLAPTRAKSLAHRPGSLYVAVGSSLLALGVLVAASMTPVDGYTVTLAVATLVAGLVRTVVAFQQVRLLAAARHQATTDDLTGLPNRRALTTLLEAALTTNESDGGFALLLIDLDRFREVNDLLGHDVGDRLLREIGPRLAPALRAGDVLARLGGDEFGLMLPGADETLAVRVAHRLSETLRAPFVFDDITQQMSGSIGVALCPRHADTAHGLIQCADVAMHAAKSHRIGVEVYDPVHGAEGRNRLTMAKQLTLALETDQFVLHYQPKIDVGNGEVVGVEALVRWQHPHLGLVDPDVFLPLAEQIGCMDQLTKIVLATAVAQGREWRLDGLDLKVAINLSASNLMDEELVQDIAVTLTKENFPADALILEITESTLMADGPYAIATLHALHELGISLSVDDYGTGFSSLTYIRDLPVQELKIDRSFVTHLTENGRDVAIVKSTIELAHSLGLHVVAEGVENEEALTLLRQLGCDLVQGYHLCRPRAANELTTWLRGQTIRDLNPAHNVTPIRQHAHTD